MAGKAQFSGAPHSCRQEMLCIRHNAEHAETVISELLKLDRFSGRVRSEQMVADTLRAFLPGVISVKDLHRIGKGRALRQIMQPHIARHQALIIMPGRLNNMVVRIRNHNVHALRPGKQPGHFTALHLIHMVADGIELNGGYAFLNLHHRCQPLHVLQRDAFLRHGQQRASTVSNDGEHQILFRDF